MRRQHLDALQAPLEEVQNWRDLPLHTLMRSVDPKQRLFQFRRAIQRVDTVVRQGAPQRADKGWRKSFTTRLQHAQVGKQIRLTAGLFAAGPMIYLRITFEQGTYIDKNVKDLVFGLSYFVAVAGHFSLHPASSRAMCFGNASKPSISWRSSTRLWRHIDWMASPFLSEAADAPKTTRFVAATVSSLAAGSICRSGAPVSTCTLGMVITCRTFPENGATTCISIFMASSTAMRSPTTTVSPGFTRRETTTAGAGACTTPPSSRSIWCETLSTSIR